LGQQLRLLPHLSLLILFEKLRIHGASAEAAMHETGERQWMRSARRAGGANAVMNGGEWRRQRGASLDEMLNCPSIFFLFMVLFFLSLANGQLERTGTLLLFSNISNNLSRLYLSNLTKEAVLSASKKHVASKVKRMSAKLSQTNERLKEYLHSNYPEVSRMLRLEPEFKSLWSKVCEATASKRPGKNIVEPGLFLPVLPNCQLPKPTSFAVVAFMLDWVALAEATAMNGPIKKTVEAGKFGPMLSTRTSE